MKVFAIIPAGGVGKRVNNSLPKQYIKFHGKELIAYTLQVFQNCDLIDEIIVASQTEYFHLINSIKERYNLSKLSRITEGGSERQYSVFNAVKLLNADRNDIILVHDAVRPLLPAVVLNDAISTVNKFGSAVVAIKAKDTLIKGVDSVQGYVDRNEIYYVQTPQAFKYEIFMDAMKQAEKDNFIGTDESMLVKRAGYNIRIVNGSILNFKITTEDDIKLFDMITGAAY